MIESNRQKNKVYYTCNVEGALLLYIRPVFGFAECAPSLIGAAKHADAGGGVLAGWVNAHHPGRQLVLVVVRNAKRLGPHGWRLLVGLLVLGQRCGSAVVFDSALALLAAAERDQEQVLLVKRRDELVLQPPGEKDRENERNDA